MPVATPEALQGAVAEPSSADIPARIERSFSGPRLRDRLDAFSSSIVETYTHLNAKAKAVVLAATLGPVLALAACSGGSSDVSAGTAEPTQAGGAQPVAAEFTPTPAPRLGTGVASEGNGKVGSPVEPTVVATAVPTAEATTQVPASAESNVPPEIMGYITSADSIPVLEDAVIASLKDNLKKDWDRAGGKKSLEFDAVYNIYSTLANYAVTTRDARIIALMGKIEGDLQTLSPVDHEAAKNGGAFDLVS